jgi:hypothetical protein
VVAFERTPQATTVVCADGIGTGIRAHIAATMATARLLELLRLDFSLRRAFGSLVKTMEAAKKADLPYVAFSVARILPEGETTVLCYEAPGPLLVGRRNAAVLPRRTMVVEGALTEETHCHLEPGEGVLLMSDGITQAGLGGQIKGGWQIEGVAQYVSDLLARGVLWEELCASVNRRAVALSADTAGDDTTVVLASCRWGKTVHILTGPPSDRRKDAEVANRFLSLEGPKIICGATTAEIVARVLKEEVMVDPTSQSLLAPPTYVLKSVDLVTEGAVTLNQLYNVLDESPAMFDERSGVTDLYQMLAEADRVHILLGTAHNPAADHISFRQRGLLPRARIVHRIAEQLREAGKLVVIEHI